MKRFLVFGLICLTGNYSFATQADVSRFHFSFDARSAAVAGADAALPDDQFAINNNPAGLGRLKSASMQFSQENMTQDVSAKSVVINTHSQNIGFAAAYRFLNFGTTPRTTTAGKTDGTFEGFDRLAIFGLGIPWGEHLSLGMSGKHIESSIDRYQADTWAGHAGVRIDNVWNDHLSLGFSADNLVSSGNFKFETESEQVPKILRGGLWYQATSKRFGVGLQYDDFSAAAKNMEIGLETIFFRNNTLGVTGRAGYSSAKSGIGGMALYTAGLGFQWKTFQLDWAWIPYDEFGMNQLISLGFVFSPSSASELANAASKSTDKIESFYMKDGRILKGHVFAQDDKVISVEIEDHWFQVKREDMKFRR